MTSDPRGSVPHLDELQRRLPLAAVALLREMTGCTSATSTSRSVPCAATA
ncbi:hypothetical protein ABZ860_02600 [Microbispora sp. NPDC046973]